MIFRSGLFNSFWASSAFGPFLRGSTVVRRSFTVTFGSSDGDSPFTLSGTSFTSALTSMVMLASSFKNSSRSRS